MQGYIFWPTHNNSQMFLTVKKTRNSIKFFYGGGGNGKNIFPCSVDDEMERREVDTAWQTVRSFDFGVNLLLVLLLIVLLLLFDESIFCGRGWVLLAGHPQSRVHTPFQGELSFTKFDFFPQPVSFFL